jgi:hypothetical protein
MFITAKCKGVHPKLSLELTSILKLLSLKKLSIESVPLSNYAAQCNTFKPFRVYCIGDAFKSRMIMSIILWLPFNTAKCKAILPPLGS